MEVSAWQKGESTSFPPYRKRRRESVRKSFLILSVGKEGERYCRLQFGGRKKWGGERKRLSLSVFGIEKV
jgi:hypothetical protein